MDNTNYNGWTNYETWCVNLWLDNEQGSSDQIAEWTTEAVQDAINRDFSDVRAEATSQLADQIQRMHEEAMPEVTGIFADLLNASLREVNWYEIAEHAIGDIVIYSAGWNTPGYMPDNPPALFLDADDAMSHIQDAAKDATEYDSEEAEDKAGDEIDGWKANAKGEFGQKFAANFYFVSIV